MLAQSKVGKVESLASPWQPGFGQERTFPGPALVLPVAYWYLIPLMLTFLICLLLHRYHGEKLQTFSKAKKPRPDSHILISTVYDEPQPQDTWDELFRCQPPTAMKYRRDMAFVRETHSAQKSPGAS